jgi:hypothetical protein
MEDPRSRPAPGADRGAHGRQLVPGGTETVAIGVAEDIAAPSVTTPYI